MKHTHHIIPRHMGGTDDPSNLVELTIEEHAEAHRKLYEEHGHWQDKVAYKGLAGLIGHEEIMREMYDARKGKGNIMYGKPCHYKMTEEEKTRWRNNIGKAFKGKKHSAEHVKKRCPWIDDPTTNGMYGKTPWNKGKKLGPQSAELRRKKGRPLIYKNKEYNTINEAERLTGVSAYKITKECKFITK